MKKLFGNFIPDTEGYKITPANILGKGRVYSFLISFNEFPYFDRNDTGYTESTYNILGSKIMSGGSCHIAFHSNCYRSIYVSILLYIYGDIYILKDKYMVENKFYCLYKSYGFYLEKL